MERESEADDLPRLSPFDPATMVQTLDEQRSGLRVVFFRPLSAADRWGHVVATVMNAGEAVETVVPQLVSQEGAGPEGWPLSPPLQSLAIERRPSGAVALLVGMWGQHHWSASFEALPDRRVKIDLACRLASGAGEWHLGSTYANCSRNAERSQRMEIHCDLHGEVRVDLGAGIEMGDFPGLRLRVTSAHERPIRWNYEVQYCQ